MAVVEFSEVVRRRRMVRRFDPDRPVAAGGRAAGLAHRGAGPERRVQPGLGLRRARHPPRTGTRSGRPPTTGDASRRLAARRRAAPVLVLCLSHPDAYLDRYAEPDKGWTDRDQARWPVPYWDVDTGMAALLVLLSARRRGPRRALLRGAARSATTRSTRRFGIPAGRRIVGVVALGTRPSGSTSPSLRRRRRPARRCRCTGARSACRRCGRRRAPWVKMGPFDPRP